ncbi:uncharacterized protein LOC144450522 isoform X2 [Glandiceps talaboti]
MQSQHTNSSQSQLGSVEYTAPGNIRDMLDNSTIRPEDGTYGTAVVTGLDQVDADDSEGSSDMENIGNERGKKRSAEDDLMKREPGKDGPKPGKKTKGRVKIKMEFINNKLRRYTTFSKRKTGIMKKAYELSTLTGTQVMLLVASETGHVYTFATRKLQPMITSESGKALIQTCLNSPDPPTQAGLQTSDQRMSATGFEETELSYQVNEEEGKEGKPQIFTITNIPGAGAEGNIAGTGAATSAIQIAGAGHTFPMTSYLPTSTSANQSVSMSNSLKSNNTVNVSTMSTANSQTAGNISMQLPGGITTILPAGTPLTPGAAIQLGVQQLQAQGQQLQLQSQLQTNQQQQQQQQQQHQQQQQQHPQTVYRLQQPATSSATNLGQMVTAVAIQQPGGTTTANDDNSQQQQQTATISFVPTSQPATTGATTLTSMAGHVMYQTPQGVVYAPAPQQLTDTNLVLNYPSSTAIPTTQIQDQSGNIQQMITTLQPSQSSQGVTQLPIPIPLTLQAPSQVNTTDQTDLQGTDVQTKVVTSRPE